MIPAGDAYGERDESLVFKVNKKEFGPDAEVSPGMQFEARGEGARLSPWWTYPATMLPSTNHPLAGETLHFDVKVVDVRNASEEELHHGHVHSGGCDGGCECGCGDECGDECGCEAGCADGCCN